MRVIWAIALAAGTTAGLGATNGEGPRRPHRKEIPAEVEARLEQGQCSVQIRSPQAEARGTQEVPVFSARVHREISFAVLVQPLQRGDHALQLKLYTPRGFLYQTLVVAEPDDGRPHLHVARGLRKARLVVGGSWIKAHTLYGLWRVVPHLDGNPNPCGRARTFEITE